GAAEARSSRYTSPARGRSDLAAMFLAALIIGILLAGSARTFANFTPQPSRISSAVSNALTITGGSLDSLRRRDTCEAETFREVARSSWEAKRPPLSQVA